MARHSHQQASDDVAGAALLTRRAAIGWGTFATVIGSGLTRLLGHGWRSAGLVAVLGLMAGAVLVVVTAIGRPSPAPDARPDDGSQPGSPSDGRGLPDA